MAKIICIKTKEVLGHLPRSETLTPRAVRLWPVELSAQYTVPCKLLVLASDFIEAHAIVLKMYRELDKEKHALRVVKGDKAG